MCKKSDEKEIMEETLEEENKESKDTSDVENNQTQQESNQQVDQRDEKDELIKQIEDLQKELAVTKNAYYKAYADTENLKKRLYSDAETANKYRIQSFALSILPSLDALEIALTGKDVNDPFVKGVKLVYDQIIHALSNEGVSPIDCLNQPFDAKYHNAIMTEKVEGVKPDIVIEVMQKGYMLKDRLLRAALVKVSE